MNENINISPHLYDQESKSNSRKNNDIFDRIIGPSLETEIYVCSTRTKGLLDTGSAVSTMSKSFFDSLCPKPRLHHINELVVNIADGSNLPYHGYVEVEFEIPGISGSEITLPCLVVSDTVYNGQVPIIIGTNYLRTCFQCDMSSQPLPEEWEMARKTLSISRQSLGQVRSTNNKHVLIQPQESIVLSGLVRKGNYGENCTAITEQGTELPGC